MMMLNKKNDSQSILYSSKIIETVGEQRNQPIVCQQPCTTMFSLTGLGFEDSIIDLQILNPLEL
jgi:hypothetical protein